MFQQRFFPTTPSLRFKKLPKFIDSNNIYKIKKSLTYLIKIKTTRFGKPLNHRIQYKKRNLTMPYKLYTTALTTQVIVSFDFLKPFSKELVLLKDLFNYFYFKPALNIYYPGFYFSSLKHDYSLRSEFIDFLSFITLEKIPYYIKLSHISSIYRLWASIACSTGAFAFKKRDLVRSKLVSIKLPSGQVKYLLKYRFCYVGFIQSYLQEDSFLGSWGQFWKFKKKRIVRGVAKNPIDHPNGGRTKVKQPECSPWGWVAKHNK